MHSRSDGTLRKFEQLFLKRKQKNFLKDFDEYGTEFLDIVPGFLWRCDQNGFCTYFNRSWLEFRGRTLDEEMGSGWMEGVHPDDLENALSAQAKGFQDKSAFVRHFRVLGSDNRYHWIKDCASPVFQENAEMSGFAGCALDITAEYECQQILRESAEKKETLLREAHHRFKNNLQILSSLFHLQNQEINRETAHATFKDFQNRVNLIALLHQKLLQDQLSDGLNFSDYVAELTKIVKSSYAREKVQLKLEVEPTGMDPDKVIPCGLIINELLSNSLKYAFPNENSGEILIRFYSKEQYFVLEISDDGVGLEDDIQIVRPNSLGLQLVSTLTRQLRGSAEMSYVHGTKISIRFPR